MPILKINIPLLSYGVYTVYDILCFGCLYQVYMINLKRRPDRRKKMEECFEEIGIDYQYVEAVDGK